MLILVVVVSLIAVHGQDFENRYEQPRPGRYMEYGVEAPRRVEFHEKERGEPIMFMHYRDYDGAYLPDYQNGYRRSKPVYRSLGSEWRNSDQVPPPFPFTLPYQYVDKPYETSSLPSYRPATPTRAFGSSRSMPLFGRERGYFPLSPFFAEDSFYPRSRPSPPSYGRVDEIRRHPKSVPEFESKVDEIEARILSMMGPLSRPYRDSPRMSTTGYSTESQYGYQMLF